MPRERNWGAETTTKGGQEAKGPVGGPGDPVGPYVERPLPQLCLDESVSGPLEETVCFIGQTFAGCMARERDTKWSRPSKRRIDRQNCRLRWVSYPRCDHINRRAAFSTEANLLENSLLRRPDRAGGTYLRVFGGAVQTDNLNPHVMLRS
jgi:hypothetical protein